MLFWNWNGNDIFRPLVSHFFKQSLPVLYFYLLFCPLCVDNINGEIVAWRDKTVLQTVHINATRNIFSPQECGEKIFFIAREASLKTIRAWRVMVDK